MPDPPITLRGLSVRVDALETKVGNIEKMPGKIARTLGALIIAGAALTNIVTYLTHEDSAQKLQQAAQSADKAAGVGTQTLTVAKDIKAAQTNAAQTNAAGP
jgi:hypothetical protein